MPQTQDGTVTAGILTLIDARGQAAPVTSKERTDDGTGGAEEYRITFRVAVGEAEGARLELQARRHVSAEVPFTLRDVPLSVGIACGFAFAPHHKRPVVWRT